LQNQDFRLEARLIQGSNLDQRLQAVLRRLEMTLGAERFGGFDCPFLAISPTIPIDFDTTE